MEWESDRLYLSEVSCEMDMSSEEMEDPVWLETNLSSSGKISSLRWIPTPALRPKPIRRRRPKRHNVHQSTFFISGQVYVVIIIINILRIIT